MTALLDPDPLLVAEMGVELYAWMRPPRLRALADAAELGVGATVVVVGDTVVVVVGGLPGFSSTETSACRVLPTPSFVDATVDPVDWISTHHEPEGTAIS